MKGLGRYLLNILISIDQLINVIFGGSVDETVSSRLGRQKRQGRLKWYNKWLADFLDWIDDNHVLNSIELGAYIRTHPELHKEVERIAREHGFE